MKASDMVIGLILEQSDYNGDEYVIEYASKILTKDERMYNVAEEHLEILCAAKNSSMPFGVGCVKN